MMNTRRIHHAFHPPSWCRKFGEFYLFIIVISGVALTACAQGEKPITVEGYEIVFGHAGSSTLEAPSVGSFRIFQASPVQADSLAPIALKGKALRLESEGQEKACVTDFKRKVTKGETLRLSLQARLIENEQIQFGLEGDDVRYFLSLKADGSIVWYNGSDYQPLQPNYREEGEWRHKPGVWQHYAIEYVVGADQVLITAGRWQTTANVKPVSWMDASFIETGEGFGTGEFGNMEVSLPEPPGIKDLPTFGSIEWRREEMPFIARGPRGGISGMGFTELNGKLYLAGGFIPAGDESGEAAHRTSKWSYSYDVAQRKWTKLPDLPARREYGKATAAGNTIYFVGGLQQRPPEPHADVYAMDVSSSKPSWSILPSISIPRTHLAIGVVKNTLIVSGGNEYNSTMGGYHPSTMRNITEILDLSNINKGWMTVAPPPGPPRGWSACVAAKGKLYLFGGATFVPRNRDGTGAATQRFSNTLAYDPEKNTWETLAQAPVAISGWNGGLYKDRYVILVGGTYKVPGSGPCSSSPLVYDITEDKWLKMEKSHTPPGGAYNDPGVAIVGEEIFLAGGEAKVVAHYNTFLVGRIRQH